MAEPEGVERDLLIAAFETRRFLYLTEFMHYPDHVHTALAFAWSERICPIYHRTLEREAHDVDCFSAVYKVKPDDMDELIQHLNDRRLHTREGEPITGVVFYELEAKFGKRIDRSGLIDCIRYCFLADAFDDELYRAIEANAPVEAHHLMRDFSPEEVEL